MKDDKRTGPWELHDLSREAGSGPAPERGNWKGSFCDGQPCGRWDGTKRDGSPFPACFVPMPDVVSLGGFRLPSYEGGACPPADGAYKLEDHVDGAPRTVEGSLRAGKPVGEWVLEEGWSHERESRRFCFDSRGALSQEQKKDCPRAPAKPKAKP